MMSRRLMQFGYSSSWKRLSWNVSWSYSILPDGDEGTTMPVYNTSEQIYMLSLSVPLSGWWGNVTPPILFRKTMIIPVAHINSDSAVRRWKNNLSWNLMRSYSSPDDRVGGNMSLTYDGSYGTVNSSYNYSQNSQRPDYGIRGNSGTQRRGNVKSGVR